MIYLVLISVICFILGASLTYCLVSYFQKKALRKAQFLQSLGQDSDNPNSNNNFKGVKR